MKIITNLLLSITILLLCFSCSDIFEEPIDDKQVEIVAPGDSTKSTTYGVTFWWNPLEGALKYNLQIVAPDFNSVTNLVLDTMVSSTKFTYTLDPGTYQWRIRAENGSTKTPYTTRVITVDTSGLSSQPIYTTSPVTSTSFNLKTVSFSWQSMYGATSYILEIDTITGTFSDPVRYTQTTPYNGCTYSFNNDGSFRWRVKAVNATEESLYSTVKEFTIDTDKPTTVSNLSSLGTTKPISLSWGASNSPDVLSYKLYAYKVTASDTSIYSQAYNPKIITAGTAFSFNEGTSGNKIVWRVKAVDKAGNESAFSPYSSFTIGF